jgi:hypothetical protein
MQIVRNRHNPAFLNPSGHAPNRFCLTTSINVKSFLYSKNPSQKEKTMPESVYKIIELVGTSSSSWEEAAKNAVNMAGKSLENIRIAEVTELDMKIENNQVAAYRAKIKVSFKFRDK